MGSIGKGTEVPARKNWVGESVKSLYESVQRREGENYKDNYDRIRKEFNISEATEKQIEKLKQIIGGMNEYDTAYDENRTPYKINYFSITQDTRSEEDKEFYKSVGMRNVAPAVHLSIYTEPNTENSLIRVMDEKSRSVMIGADGGLFTYNKNGKKQAVKLFDATYGKRTWKG